MAVGQFFRLPDGRRVALNAITGFDAYGQFLRTGPDSIRPVLEQRRDLGFTEQRVFTAYEIPLIGRLIPMEHADYYDRVPEFVALCGAYRQYVEFVGITANPGESVFATQQQMIDHDARLKAILAPLPAFYEQVNEYNNGQQYSNVPWDRLAPAPPSLLYAAGSGIQGSFPRTPHGTYTTYHPSSSEWQRKVGHNGAEEVAWHTGLPNKSNETVRIEPSGETNPIHCYDAAKGIPFFIAGGCFHSRQAKSFSLLTDPELYCARAWCDGFRSIATDQRQLTICQDGTYARLDPETYLRRYEKRHGGEVVSYNVRW